MPLTRIANQRNRRLAKRSGEIRHDPDDPACLRETATQGRKVHACKNREQQRLRADQRRNGKCCLGQLLRLETEQDHFELAALRQVPLERHTGWGRFQQGIDNKELGCRDTTRKPACEHCPAHVAATDLENAGSRHAAPLAAAGRQSR